jgi:hypothetical protein
MKNEIIHFSSTLPPTLCIITLTREQSVVSASFRLFASAHIAVWQTLFATG